MKIQRFIGSMTLMALAGLVTACGNSAVDPEATYKTRGLVVDAAGQPVQDAEVTLIKYWDDTRLLQPSVDRVFSSNPETYPGLASLNVEVVTTGRTGTDGRFDLEALGAELAIPGGYSTTDGLVEVAKVIAIVRDPSDASGQTGIWTYSHEFMRSARIWDSDMMGFWDSGAEADGTAANTSGRVLFRWNAVQRNTSVKNAYRLTVRDESSPSFQLAIYCNEGDEVQGGCSPDGQQLVRYISAFTLLNYYSNASGDFEAFVDARGSEFRYRSRFTVIEIPDVIDDRDPVDGVEIWAVGPTSDQQLGPAATDGDASTREQINNNATALYVKLPLSTITDAGVLNALVTNIANGCLELHVSPNELRDIEAAKNSSESEWVARGKFCGETGSLDEISAIAGFDTTSSDGVIAAWLRIRAVADGVMGTPTFQAVGEVALYQKTGM